MSNSDESAPPRPQLYMVRAHLDGLPELQVAAPYRLRTYQAGDERAWAEIMNTGIGEGWTAEKCREFMVDRSEFRPDGLFFARRDEPSGEEVVGTTCAWRKDPGEQETGIVHMVCVHPDHRGHRLGSALVLATLHYFRRNGFRRASLSTDDFRLAAIRTYLDLGFEPEITDPSHPERWAAVRRELAG